MNKHRLYILADHLLYGEKKLDKWSFGIIYHKNFDCKTSGCALGECTNAFTEWVLKDGAPIYSKFIKIRSNYRDSFSSAQAFFGTSQLQTSYLFAPTDEIDADENIKNKEAFLWPIKVSATKHEVAYRIIDFILSGGKVLNKRFINKGGYVKKVKSKKVKK